MHSFSRHTLINWPDNWKSIKAKRWRALTIGFRIRMYGKKRLEIKITVTSQGKKMVHLVETFYRVCVRVCLFFFTSFRFVCALFLHVFASINSFSRLLSNFKYSNTFNLWFFHFTLVGVYECAFFSLFISHFQFEFQFQCDLIWVTVTWPRCTALHCIWWINRNKQTFVHCICLHFI